MIRWSEKTVKVSVLKPFERNPWRTSRDAFNERSTDKSLRGMDLADGKEWPKVGHGTAQLGVK